MYTVYILQSIKNGRFYTGQTVHLDRRLVEHNSGKNKSTASKGPYRLVHTEEYATRLEAVQRERYLKTGKGRDELKKLIQ